MDLVSITQQEKKVSLLTLSRSDLQAPSDQKNPENSNKSQENESASSNELVLMQLPSGVQISDLASGCYFVAPQEQDSSKADAKTSSTKQACLVMEGKKQSYVISRLETSNVLVLVPPVDEATTTKEIPITTASTSNHLGEGPAIKKTKMTTTTSLLPVPARLLKAGGSGASFLELRSKLLRPGDLAKLLKKHVFDPYNTNRYRKAAVGRSISCLANELQCSRGQVEDTLKLLRSFPMPLGKDNTTFHYGVLSEEALQEAQNALISTLAESDDFCDYAHKGVNLEDFVAQALERLPLDQTYSQQEHVLRYALTTLFKGDDENLPLLVNCSKTERVQLDVKKIAVWLAHRLFQAQTKPWEESRFRVRWQSELPGVGKAYQVSVEMLRGVAIRAEDSSPRKPKEEEEAVYWWKYFPANKLPLNAEQRFQALFALRDHWSSEDLEPYLNGLVKDTGLSPAEILLQYTTRSPSPRKGKDGMAIKLYCLKR